MNSVRLRYYGKGFWERWYELVLNGRMLLVRVTEESILIQNDKSKVTGDLISKSLRKTLPKTLRTPKPQNRSHKNILIYKTVRHTPVRALLVTNMCSILHLCRSVQERHAHPIIVLKRSMLINQWIFLVYKDPLLTYDYTGKWIHLRPRKTCLSLIPLAKSLTNAKAAF